MFSQRFGERTISSNVWKLVTNGRPRIIACIQTTRLAIRYRIPESFRPVYRLGLRSEMEELRAAWNFVRTASFLCTHFPWLNGEVKASCQISSMLEIMINKQIDKWSNFEFNYKCFEIVLRISGYYNTIHVCVFKLWEHLLVTYFFKKHSQNRNNWTKPSFNLELSWIINFIVFLRGSF